MTVQQVASYAFEEAMPVSERLYLKKNSTGLCRGQIFGVCSTESMGVFSGFIKPQIFGHRPDGYRYRLEEIGIAGSTTR
jgi:hypothetical protein